MSTPDFEEAKKFLQKTNLYEHISEVLLKILTERPEDAVSMFEQISLMVKQGRPVEVDSGAKHICNAEWPAKVLGLFGEQEPVEGVDPQPIQDLLDEMTMLEWAGIGLGREETYRVYLALKRLAATVPASKLRFWGKILGKDADYFIAEGEIEREAAPETDGRGLLIEQPGEGINKSCYWVCSNIGDQWTQLPDVTPEQIIGSRLIRRFFTGDLEAPVPGYPPFSGVEKNLLRATIARITAANSISPAGFFVHPEDDENEFAIAPAEAEELEVPAELKDLGVWVHHSLELNTLGRTAPLPQQEDEEGNPIEDPDAPEPSPMLRPVAEEEGDWGVRACPPCGGDHALVGVRSLRWPGAVSVGFGKKFINVYVGFGLKHADSTYTPPAIPDLAKEFDEEEFGLKEGEEVLDDPDAGKGEEEEEA